MNTEQKASNATELELSYERIREIKDDLDVLAVSINYDRIAPYKNKLFWRLQKQYKAVEKPLKKFNELLIDKTNELRPSYASTEENSKDLKVDKNGSFFFTVENEALFSKKVKEIRKELGDKTTKLPIYPLSPEDFKNFENIVPFQFIESLSGILFDKSIYDDIMKTVD